MIGILSKVVGDCSAQQVADLLECVWGGSETLVIVSSDLSHYLPYEKAVAVDKQTAQAIVDRSTMLDADRACGAHAINGLMVVANARNLDVHVLDVRNSGNTVGDKSRVVGYGAYALIER